jgi:DNA-binding response OmpR family regulator
MGDKSILIIDEKVFYRISSAILESMGYAVELFTDAVNLPARLFNKEVGLIVINYPYGASMLNEIKKWDIATIVLTDKLDGNLFDLLNGFEKSYCMVKPLDYDKFKAVIQEVMSDTIIFHRGYSIV